MQYIEYEYIHPRKYGTISHKMGMGLIDGKYQHNLFRRFI